MSSLLDIRGLEAGYGSLAVVHGLDLCVEPGEVVALLGANGAGKTTTVMTIAGILPPLGGHVNVLDRPVVTLRRAHETIRRGLGVVPENRGLFPSLTGWQHLGLASREKSEIDRVLEIVPDIVGHLDKRVGVLSGGEQQMLALARAIVRRPRLLVVDEMSLGLAPLVAAKLGRLLRQLADVDDVGVLVVEQHLEIALSICDRAVLLQRGALAFAGTPDDVLQQPNLLEGAYLGGEGARVARSR